MGHGLRVGRHLVVLVVRQVDVAALEWREHLLDPLDVRVRRAVLDHDLRAGLRVSGS